MTKRYSFVLVLLLVACGGKSLSRVLPVNFNATVICNTTPQLITLQNEGGEERVIGGASIAAGTDPDGNFSIVSVVVGETETKSVGGSLSNVSIPAGVAYNFKVNYNPKTAGVHRAVIDVAYSSPEISVDQLQLSGEGVTGESSNCVVFSEGGPVDFDGTVTLTVDKLVVATSKISSAISSDQGVTEFIPVPLPLLLDRANQTSELPEIKTENLFLLPPPSLEVPILGGKLKSNTVITTTGKAGGTYDPSQGSLTVNEVVITIDTDFNTTVTTTLTTEEVTLTGLRVPLHPDAIKQFGSLHYDSVKKNKIMGGRINPETGEFALVGTTMIESSTLDPGADSTFSPAQMRGVVLAILMEGKISLPSLE